MRIQMIHKERNHAPVFVSRVDYRSNGRLDVYGTIYGKPFIEKRANEIVTQIENSKQYESYEVRLVE